MNQATTGNTPSSFSGILGPQKDIITLDEAKARTKNWRDTVSQIFDAKYLNLLPRAFFIPFDDIREIEKLKETITMFIPPGYTQEVPISIVGVRAYFTLNNVIIAKDPTYAPLDAILVAVYQIGNKAEYDCTQPTFDLIIEATRDKILPPLCTIQKPKYHRNESVDDQYYTIYDITQPCPQLCDADSLLNQ